MSKWKDEIMSAKKIAIDIEIFDVQTLACVGFAVSPDKAYVLPAKRLDDIREILESPIPKILQNAQFDLHFLLTRCGIKVGGRIDDTLVAWHACYPELAGASTDSTGAKKGVKRTHKSLAFFASLFTRDAYWKGDYSTVDEFFVYNGKDCCITFDVMEKLDGLIKQQGVREIYEHMLRQIWPCVYITARGLRVDESLRTDRLRALETRIMERAGELSEIALPLLEQARGRVDLRLFEKRAVCKCCKNGANKRDACWKCAGFDDKPSKKALNGTELKPCIVCKGAGEFRWLEFNPNSTAQRAQLLFEVLKMPKKYNDGSLTTDEDALKSLLAYCA